MRCLSSAQVIFPKAKTIVHSKVMTINIFLISPSVHILSHPNLRSQYVTSRFEILPLLTQAKITRETLFVSFDGLFQSFRFYSIGFSQVSVQHNLMPTDEKNRLFNQLRGDERLWVSHSV